MHESNEFPADYARFVVSPVIDASGSDYAYIMLGESVRETKKSHGVVLQAGIMAVGW